MLSVTKEIYSCSHIKMSVHLLIWWYLICGNLLALLAGECRRLSAQTNLVAASMRDIKSCSWAWLVCDHHTFPVDLSTVLLSPHIPMNRTVIIHVTWEKAKININ